jgi:hypothetical protein
LSHPPMDLQSSGRSSSAQLKHLVSTEHYRGVQKQTSLRHLQTLRHVETPHEEWQAFWRFWKSSDCRPPWDFSLFHVITNHLPVISSVASTARSGSSSPSVFAHRSRNHISRFFNFSQLQSSL